MSTRNGSVAIALRAVSAGYGERSVLHDVDLEIAAGDLVGLIGPNGAGKSSLLRVMTGVLRPRSGQVWLDGLPVARLGPGAVARRVAVVPQAPLLPAGFTVADVVAMGRYPHLGLFGGEAAADRRAIRLALEQTGTIGLAARRIDELSGGERQRVVVARALAQATPSLLLDEPTTHLDPGHQAEILHLVARLRDERSLTVVVVLHDLTLAGRFCPRLVLVDRGSVVADGTPEAVMRPEVLGPAYGAGVVVSRLEDGSLAVIADPAAFGRETRALIAGR